MHLMQVSQLIIIVTMKLQLFALFVILSVISFWNVNCELSGDEVNNLLQIYEMNVNASLSLSRGDKELLNSWQDDHQVQQVNVTTKFRLQMRSHKDHSFKKDDVDLKWTQCSDFYSDDVTKSERQYYKDESACLKRSNEESKEKRQNVDQVEREIKKWRKSYKYLSHLCEIDNSDDEDGAKTCLVEYIERDNYNSTLQRLLLLKLEAMGELYLQLTTSIENLEECLRTAFSDYLNKVRTLMKILNKCYNGSKKV